jgi:DNA-directed RNA polymerase beta subunit
MEFDENVKIFEGVSLGKIPVMLGSSLCIMNDYPMTKEEIGECTYDPFGYFIIHGSERTILCQEKVADNRVMIFFNKKSASKFTYSAEMKSLHESFTTPPKKLEARVSSKFNGLGYPLTICIPRFREDIPLMERAWRGMQSRFAGLGPLSHLERPLELFHHFMAKRLPPG